MKPLTPEWVEKAEGDFASALATGAGHLMNLPLASRH